MTNCTNQFQGMRFLVATASFQNAGAVTPSNIEDLTTTASALYIGSAGALKVDMEGEGEAVIFAAVPVGLLPIRVTRVYATGTVAGSIIALW